MYFLSNRKGTPIVTPKFTTQLFVHFYFRTHISEMNCVGE